MYIVKIRVSLRVPKPLIYYHFMIVVVGFVLLSTIYLDRE